MATATAGRIPTHPSLVSPAHLRKVRGGLVRCLLQVSRDDVVWEGGELGLVQDLPQPHVGDWVWAPGPCRLGDEFAKLREEGVGEGAVFSIPRAAWEFAQLAQASMKPPEPSRAQIILTGVARRCTHHGKPMTKRCSESTAPQLYPLHQAPFRRAWPCCRRPSPF